MFVNHWLQHFRRPDRSGELHAGRSGALYRARRTVTSPKELRAILGRVLPTQASKVIDHIDKHCQTWIERCPFVVIASYNAAGEVDVSPKGDPPGFVKIVDHKTLAIPDRIGNHRGDTLANVLDNPRIGLMFVIPKRGEVLRVSGAAQIVLDTELLDRMIVNGHRPDLALLVRVEEAFFHCGKSMIRSRMWHPDQWGSIDGLPTYAQALRDHGQLSEPTATVEGMVAENEEKRLY